MRPNIGQESHTSAAPLSPPLPFCPLLQWLTKSSYAASKPAGWPTEPAGYELCSSLIHLPPCPTEPVAAPSRRAVQQLAAPGQLDEERRTSVVVSVHAAAS